MDDSLCSAGFGYQARICNSAGTRLLAEPQPGDCCAVPLDILARQVCQQATPLADEFEKSAARVEIMLVCPQMIGQPVDPLGEERNLNLRRTSIFGMRAKLGNDGLFLFCQKRHTY